MKRTERDFYEIRRNDGKHGLGNAFHSGNGHFDTYDEAKDYFRKTFTSGTDRIICHVEVYRYFDVNGIFVKEERLTQAVE